MQSLFVVVITLIITVLQVGAAPGQDTRPAEQKITFDDAIRLENDHVRVDVAPSVGRIVWFSRPGGDNLIWINDETAVADSDGQYIAYGGDKVWPAVQSMWERATGNKNWPPEGVIDGKPWTLIEASNHHCIIESEVSPAYGVKVRRTIIIDPDAPIVNIANAMTRAQPSIYPVHIWSVTQIIPPDYAMLDIAEKRVQKDPAVVLFDPEDTYGDGVTTLPGQTAVAWHDRHEGGNKIGTLGEWVAGVYEDQIFLQKTYHHAPGAYPDGSSAQLWVQDGYTELELLSDQVHLQPGESLKNVVEWRLVDFTGGEPEEALKTIDAALK